MTQEPRVVIETEAVRVLCVDDNKGLYDVYCSGVLRHPGCTSEDAMRALGQYIYSHEYRLRKEVEKKAESI